MKRLPGDLVELTSAAFLWRGPDVTPDWDDLGMVASRTLAVVIINDGDCFCAVDGRVGWLLKKACLKVHRG